MLPYTNGEGPDQSASRENLDDRIFPDNLDTLIPCSIYPAIRRSPFY